MATAHVARFGNALRVTVGVEAAVVGGVGFPVAGGALTGQERNVDVGVVHESPRAVPTCIAYLSVEM